MSLVKANGAGEVSTGFYNGVATQSLRFDDGSDTYLYNEIDSTPSSTTQTTVSFWVKRASIGDNIIFCGYTSAPNVAHYINFNSADKLVIYLDKTAGGSDETSWNSGNMVFRDTTNFYHILVQYDVGQASNDNKVKVYVNGSQITLTVSQTGSAVTAHRLLDSGIRERWGNYFNSGADFDGYLAEVNVIDGQVVSQNSFGETKDGVWIAKKYTGSYGNNGYRLQFKETGDGQSTASSSTIGADTSGNNHHFQDYNFDAHDSNMPDSPENNFSTLNKLDARYGTLAEGNLKNTYATTGELIRSTFAQKSGKWYAEVNCIAGSGFNLGIYPTGNLNKDSDTNYGCQYRGATGQKVVSNSVSSYGATYGVNDIIGIAVDMDNNTVTFYKNNSSQGSISYTIDEHHAFSSYISSGNTAFWNFGQDSSFGGNETAQNNTDGNGVGDFYYTPPSGYLALCSANLDDVTIGPNSTTQADDYFNSVLYTGNGYPTSDGQTISGVGFQPDWVWLKSRSLTHNHSLYDSPRGATKELSSNVTTAEGTESSFLTAFNSDGFVLGAGNEVNEQNGTFVSWNWKAGGAPTADNSAGAGNTPTSNSVKIDGSNLGSALAGTIPATRLSANTTAGFSIVTYTGTGTQSDTVAHGLGKKPAWYFTKSRSEAQNWHVYHEELDASAPENYIITLNASNAKSSSSADFWNSTAPTTSVVSVGDDNSSNKNGTTYVMYCFAEIEGYSKFGGYTGNGSTDGTFVFTGFRPAWVFIKQTNSTGSWLIHDNKRSPFNVIDEDLFANLASAESDNGVDKDFLSNGFKHRASHSAVNGSSSTYIYMAFAEQPYKFSNAR